MHIVYSPDYGVDIGEHVFPTIKYGKVKEKLINDGLLTEKDFIVPQAARDSEILLVHTEEYLQKLKEGTLSREEILTLELPYSKDLVKASYLTVGGTIKAAQYALSAGVGIHLGGGFHHAFPDHGEGFCVLNDVAVAIRKLKQEGKIQKALVIDCDLHQGNGTAYIFSQDKNVFTFSIHQFNNYPFLKEKSDRDINLRDGTGNEEYLEELKRHIPEIIGKLKPELIVYLAGADPYRGDQLGGLNLSIEGLRMRDEFVCKMSNDFKIPLTITMAGGYAVHLEDTVRIHYNTIKTTLNLMST